MLKDRRPVPQPISRMSKSFGALRSGSCWRMDFRARELASWTEGLESHDAASALNLLLPVRIWDILSFELESYECCLTRLSDVATVPRNSGSLEG